jgi:hypothetical protein
MKIPPALALQVAADLSRPQTVIWSTEIWRHQAMEGVGPTPLTRATLDGLSATPDLPLRTRAIQVNANTATGQRRSRRFALTLRRPRVRRRAA